MKRPRSTRQSRRSERQLVGQLGAKLLAKKTVVLYKNAIKQFLSWLQAEEVSWPDDPDDLEEVLHRYVEHCWAEGDSKADFANLLSSISHPLTGIARIAKYIRGAWKFYGLWVKLEQKQRCLPMSPKMCRMIAGQCLRHGWHDMSFVVLLAFHCLLRTQEFCECRCGDLQVSRLGNRGVLNLPDTKSGKRSHKTESVTVTDRRLLAFGQSLQVGKLPGDTFLGFKAATFRKRFRQVMVELEFDKLYLLPYSLRRGGATAHFRAGHSLHRTCLRGRWTSMSTARIYVNEALQDLGEFEVEVTKARSQAAQALEQFFT